MSPNRVKYRRVTFPSDWVPALKCPTCKRSVVGYYIQDAFVGSKRLTSKFFQPCMHQLTPEQEQVIINDMLKRGI